MGVAKRKALLSGLGWGKDRQCQALIYYKSKEGMERAFLSIPNYSCLFSALSVVIQNYLKTLFSLNLPLPHQSGHFFPLFRNQFSRLCWELTDTHEIGIGSPICSITNPSFNYPIYVIQHSFLLSIPPSSVNASLGLHQRGASK